MARGSGANDLLYYGAIGGGIFLGYKLAIDGDLGCDAYLAAAELYRSLNHGKAPIAPNPGSPAAKGDCAARIKSTFPGGTSAPTTAGPQQPAAPPPAQGGGGGQQAGPSAPTLTGRQVYELHDDGLCWLDSEWTDGHFTSAGPQDMSHCSNNVHHLLLEDGGGSRLHWSGGEGPGGGPSICADSNTNCYTIGQDVFFDIGSDHSDAGHQWFWAATDSLVNVFSGEGLGVGDFFTD